MKLNVLREGFYPALGTPNDEAGEIIKRSLRLQIEQQIGHDAAGLLLMGSMGIQPCIRDSEYIKAVTIAADVVKGRCPLFVGAMDNSAGRVGDRIKAIVDAARNMAIDGIVVTTPYYYISPKDDLIRYFDKIAQISPYPVFLYDLPSVTKNKISFDIAERFIKDPRFGGIKSGDFALAKDLLHCAKKPESFDILFSDLDLFDAAWKYGIRRILDGMFSCTPVNARSMYRCFQAGDMEKGSRYLTRIIELRKLFFEYGVFPSFTAAMNLLGCEGNFHVDYQEGIPEAGREKIKARMKEIGEI